MFRKGHARGVRGVSPRKIPYFYLEAERRDSDAQPIRLRAAPTTPVLEQSQWAKYVAGCRTCVRLNKAVMSQPMGRAARDCSSFLRHELAMMGLHGDVPTMITRVGSRT